MENKIGKNFDNLSQRIIYSYVGTFPKFIPVKSEAATEHSQYQFYSFMKNILLKLYNNPELLDISMVPDDYYEDWEFQNRKPELIETMRKYKKKIDDFYILLFKIGEHGVAKNNKLYVSKIHMKVISKTLSKLDNLGLKSENRKDEFVFWSDEYPDMIYAWKLLVGTSLKSNKDSLLLFSRCMFDSTYSYTSDIFKNLLENKSAFQVLEDFFEQNGYERVDIRGNEISLDWVKNYGKKDEPLKASCLEKTYGGISIYYDYKKKNQIVFGLRIPRFKDLLLHFNEMDSELKDFVILNTKKCNSCGYCTQTDKTGTRKPQFLTVIYNGEYNLCQLFPGYSFTWTYVDDKAALNIIKMLSFMDLMLEKSNTA
ncbi:hypothetical protein [Desnuesiella massiliensis]|uniref:hypothetical protein n=1 Tax=Desnuesiella massiliensis TaxID=1650662 RepID=UPI0006E44C15|nr:hypothetical protein [Desnuesiella massiliensis]